MSLRPLACRVCRRYACLSLVSVVYFRVEVSASGWSLVQRSPTECGVPECDRKVWKIRRAWPIRDCCVMWGVDSAEIGTIQLFYEYNCWMTHFIEVCFTVKVAACNLCKFCASKKGGPVKESGEMEIKIAWQSLWHWCHRECGLGSVVVIATAYGLDGPGIESRWGEIFRTSPDRFWGPPSLLYNGYRVFLGVKVRPGCDADPSPLLLPRSKIE